ncbi:MAG: hypothetical protein FRX49_00820 [Trebouxia sp. A1-2]|nr:MAG: hypothetical protein FRX49_00820 [Trebouxia sp. A1-2]
MRKLAWARRGESISPLGEPKGPFGEEYNKQKEDDYLISHDKPMVDIDFEDEGLITVQASPAATVARVALGDDDEEYDLDNLVSRE